MPQLFTNNASTTLNGAITDVATSIVVVNGAAFQSPTGSDYELLTITDGTNIEIVKMTSRSTNTLTVTRAQEGTSGFAFASGSTIQGRLTKETLEKFTQLNNGGDAKGANSVTLQPSRTASTQVASGQYGVAIGHATTASGSTSIAIGQGSSSAQAGGVSIGSQVVNDTGTNSVVIGNTAVSTGNSNTCVGNTAVAKQDGNNVSIGENATVDGPGSSLGYRCVALGGSAYVAADLHHSSAIGSEALVNTNNSMNFNAMPIIRRGVDLNNDELDSFAGMEAVLFSDEIDLKTLLDDAVAITLPTNTHFYPDEIGIIISTVSGLSTNPNVSFGITGNTTALQASTTITAMTQFDRTKFTPTSIHGQTSLTASVKTAATGTTAKGRFFWKGIFVRDE